MPNVLRSMKQLAALTLEVQDASNFRASVLAFGRVMSDLNHHLNKKQNLPDLIASSAVDDVTVRNHPITILWLSKLYSMCPSTEIPAEFQKAYEWCEVESKKPDPPPLPPMVWVVFRKSSNTNQWGQRGYWVFNKYGHVRTITLGDHIKTWNVKDKIEVPVTRDGTADWEKFLPNSERMIEVKADIPEDVYPAIVSEFGDPNE